MKTRSCSLSEIMHKKAFNRYLTCGKYPEIIVIIRLSYALICQLQMMSLLNFHAVLFFIIIWWTQCEYLCLLCYFITFLVIILSLLIIFSNHLGGCTIRISTHSQHGFSTYNLSFKRGKEEHTFVLYFNIYYCVPVFARF